MTQFLPPNLLQLFAPREPVPFLPPTDKLPHEKKRLPYGGLGEFLNTFEVNHRKIKKYLFISLFDNFRNLMKHRHQQELRQKKKDLQEK